jgi:hypothetical protein
MAVILSLGGVPLRFEIRLKEMASRIVRRYNGFLLKHAVPVITFHCTFTGRQIGAGEEAAVTREDADTWCIYRSDFICTFQGAYGTIEMRRSLYSFDACLRVLYATLLPLYNGLLIHAAGVVKDRKGYCFAGVSGSGKTTIARLSEAGARVVNDEIVIVRITQKKEIIMYGTPFWGEMHTGPAFTNKIPMQTLYFLKKDATSYVHALNNDVALAKLLRCCCIFSKNRLDLERIMNLGMKVVKNLPVYELHFEKSPAFWEVIL